MMLAGLLGLFMVRRLLLPWARSTGRLPSGQWHPAQNRQQTGPALSLNIAQRPCVRGGCGGGLRPSSALFHFAERMLHHRKINSLPPPRSSSARSRRARGVLRTWSGTMARPARARSGQVGQPSAEQPTGWRSQNQADDDEGQCHREFVLTALPRCWSAGQSGHAGHGVRWMAGNSFVGKGQFTADVRAVVITRRGILDHFAQQGASGHGMVFTQNRCHAS